MMGVRMHISCVIAHGRFVLFVVSPPDCKKDGSSVTEILSFALTVLQRQGLCLSSTHIILQHDNTAREFKNNNGLRWAASQERQTKFWSSGVQLN